MKFDIIACILWEIWFYYELLVKHLMLNCQVLVIKFEYFINCKLWNNFKISWFWQILSKFEFQILIKRIFLNFYTVIK